MYKSTMDADLNMGNVAKRIAMMRTPNAKQVESALEYVHQNVWPYLTKLDIIRMAHGDARFIVAAEREHRQSQLLNAII